MDFKGRRDLRRTDENEGIQKIPTYPHQPAYPTQDKNYQPHESGSINSRYPKISSSSYSPLRKHNTASFKMKQQHSGTELPSLVFDLHILGYASHGFRMHAPPPLVDEAICTWKLIGGAAAGDI
jgi:hypothetical protein